MNRFFKFLCNLLATIVGADCDWRREAVEGGALKLSGQGKEDDHGR